MAREYFCAYHSYSDSMRNLSDEECGRLFRALLSYSATGELPDLSDRESIAFDFMRSQIDRDQEAYEAKCKKSKDSIAKRYERIQTNTNKYERIRTNTDVYERYQGKGEGEGKGEGKGKDKGKGEDNNTRARRAGVFESFSENDQDLLDALIAFRTMRKQIKKPLTERGEELICKKLAELTPDHTVMIQILDQSIERGWQGVFPIKEDPLPARSQIQQNARGPLIISTPGGDELGMLRRLEEKEGLA